MDQNLRKRGQQNDSYYAEEPDWMEYLQRKEAEALNREKGVFEAKDRKAINTAPSVFEKGTVFVTEDKKHGKV